MFKLNNKNTISRSIDGNEKGKKGNEKDSNQGVIKSHSIFVIVQINTALM